MNYNVSFSEVIFPRVNEEISKVASESYAEDGSSLYDGIIPYSNDKPELKRLMGEAVNNIIRRLYDIITITPSNTEGVDTKLQFNVPDLDTSIEGAIAEELTDYISLFICTVWFQKKLKSRVEEYSARTTASLEKVAAMLKTRKAPTR